MKNLKTFESFLNESSDMDITKLSDDMLIAIVKAFNSAKHKLPSNDLDLLSKITLEINKRGIKESITESVINEAQLGMLGDMRDLAKRSSDAEDFKKEWFSTYSHGKKEEVEDQDTIEWLEGFYDKYKK